MLTYFLLFLAIVAEVIATTALKASASFTKLVPTIVLVVGYCSSFYLVSIVMRTLPTGITYAIWAGVGIILVSIVGYFFANEKLDAAACIGILLIVAGVVVIHVFSRSVTH